MKDLFEAVGFLKRNGRTEVNRLARSARGTLEASMRFEVVYRRGSSAENGAPRRSSEQESAAIGLSVVVGGRAQTLGYGYSGIEIGHGALNSAKLLETIRSGLKAAHQRARFSAEQRARMLREYGGSGGAWIPLLRRPI
jgi:hypothetical protein